MRSTPTPPSYHIGRHDTLPTLQVQAAWCENLTDAALSALSKSCLRLEALHIGGCVGVTDAAVAELRVAGVEVFQ